MKQHYMSTGDREYATSRWPDLSFRIYCDGTIEIKSLHGRVRVSTCRLTPMAELMQTEATCLLMDMVETENFLSTIDIVKVKEDNK